MAVRQAIRGLSPRRVKARRATVPTAASPGRVRWWRLSAVLGGAAVPLMVLPWLLWRNAVVVIVGASVIGLCAGGCWWWSRRAVARADLIDAAAELERARVAGELHDIVSETVESMVLEAEQGEAHPTEALRAIAASGRESLAELERLQVALPTVEAGAVLVRPGPAQLDALVGGARRAGLRVRLLRCGRLPRLSVSVEQAVFRVVDEALMNVVRHAGPVDVEVSLTFEVDRLTVRVVNSCSPPRTWTGEGGGLTGLRERVHVVGGDFEAGVAADGNFQVRAGFPVLAG